MKVKQIHIYGFGKWQDQSWDLNQEKMTMIAGSNEAGKSTIRAFITFILFGLPPKQRQRYLPKRGGQLGGRLVVEASDGKAYTIERLHDRLNGEAVCYDEDGQEQEANWLNEELSGIDRSLYNQIFNFDVFSLQIENGVSEEQLGEVLLSVGMTGSDRIYQAEKELDKQLDAQFKRYGSKPELNQLINQLVDKDRELKQLEDSVTAYQDHQNQSQVYQEEIKSKRADIKELTKQLNLLSQQQQIYPAIENYHLLDQQLADFPDSIDFPEQGEERYRVAKDKLQPIVADLEVAKQQVENLEADLTQLKEKLLPEETVTQIRDRLDEAEHYREQLNEQKQLDRQLEEKNQAIASQLNELKLDLSEAELLDLPINYTTNQAWEALAEEVKQTTKQLTEQEQALDTLTKRKADLEAEISDLETKTLSDREKDAAEKELEQLNQWFSGNHDHESQRLKWQSNHRIFSLVSLSVLVISIILLLTSDNSLMNGLLLGLIVIVVLIFGWQQFKFNQKWLDQLNEQTTEASTTQKARRDELVKKLTLHDNNRDKLLLSRDQFEKNQAEYLRVSESIDPLKRQQEQLRKAIEQEREQFLFLKALSVSYWPDLVKRLLGIIELIEHRNRLKNSFNQTLAKTEKFENETTNELGALLDQENKTFQKQLDQLKKISMQYEQTVEQIEVVKQRLVHVNENIKQYTAKMMPYQEEIKQLLKNANVESEEAFLSKAKRYQNWRKLTDKQQEMLRQIQLHLPESVAADILAGEFLTEKELEQQVKELDHKKAELSQALDELIEKDSKEQALLENLAHSKEVVNIKHDFYFTEDKFIEAAREWLINKIAAQQIEKTKAVFQTSYLPIVLEKASAFFTKLTDQRYSQIDFDQSDQQLFLLADDQQTYRFNELSQGTLDQLFVSIRLGISSWLAEHIQLPFLIDDGFVHFDAIRKDRVFDILSELSADHQIIYFTKETGISAQKSHHFINLE